MFRRIAETVGSLVKKRFVNLERVAQQNNLRAPACASNNALDLIRRRILGLVND